MSVFLEFVLDDAIFEGEAANHAWLCQTILFLDIGVKGYFEDESAGKKTQKKLHEWIVAH